MKIVAVFAVVAVLFLSGASQAMAAPGINPFDIDAENNPNDISRLTCQQLNELAGSHDKNIFPVIVWLDGVATAWDGQTRPFTRNIAAGILGAALVSCKDKPNTLVFDAYSDFRKKLSGSESANK